ncbi:hypothetical protein DV702_04110 [Sporosarcina sp. PTS2304]|uniref:hypothetical protein n=1 Tax=Sporosarcina sp. PTS2304 TaxID=2283194 RepID=UPI000E0DEF9A|nr:hypothetical protein [Sporosarcina sp. PTS2304]AXH98986.1 hypothetical protein DV702_04110 [Sporosarcina sp. PTS2304]
MTKEKKQLIISEIRYWKENKLLPEHYCDFLITLYAQGENPDEVAEKETSTLQKERTRLRAKQFMVLFFSLLLASLASVVMFLYTEYPTATLITAAILSLTFLAIVTRKSFIKNGFAPLVYIALAFLLLMMSLKIWTTYFPNDTTLLIALLVLNCSLWLFTGRILKLLYFTISGSLGLLTIVAFLILSL